MTVRVCERAAEDTCLRLVCFVCVCERVSLHLGLLFRFYIGCDLCSNWFHGTCVGITEDRAKYVVSYVCDDCKLHQEEPTGELYCVCRTPYDETQ